MLTNAELKQYKSLHQKKYRKQHLQFLAQGDKIVMEAVNSEWQPEIILASETWMSRRAAGLSKNIRVELVNHKQLQQVSSLKTAPDVIAVMPFGTPGEELLPPDDLILALDCIRDPGNLGTVIRIADWYGISTVLCSEDTADFMNPKVIQASMGAFLRVNIRYENLETTLKDRISSNGDLAVYGSFMDGRSVYRTELKKKSVLIMGNEGQGISPALESLCTERISIPNYPENRNEMESLNISVATGILCAEFRRQM